MAEATYSRVGQKSTADMTDVSPFVGGVQGRREHGAKTRAKRHVAAAVILFIFGILPLAIYFGIVRHPFTSEQVICGARNVGMHDEMEYGSKVSGAQSLFTIDRVSSRALPFWLAKLVDTAWDLFVARGMQLVASALSYAVLSNALLDVIRLSPVPYRTFSGLSINGASATTVIALIRDLGRHSRRRAGFLFAYSALAIIYVLAIPTLLSTMTGYISASAAYVQLPDTSQYVPNGAFQPGISFYNLSGSDSEACVTYKDVSPIRRRAEVQFQNCNSTCWTNDPMTPSYNTSSGIYLREHGTVDGCSYFRNESYSVSDAVSDQFGFYYDPNEKTSEYNCNDTVTINLAGRNYTYLSAMRNSSTPYFSLYMSGVYCYAGRSYDDNEINANTTCLPNVGSGSGSGSGASSYRWGFSSVLSSIILIVHALWCFSLYAVWWSSRRAGGELDQWRAVFAVAAAAAEATGLSTAQLVREPRKVVEELLDGSAERRAGGVGGVSGGGGGNVATVGAELFAADERRGDGKGY